MKVSYEYDQDPRYGWASVDMGNRTDARVVIHSEKYGSRGFQFKDGEMTPVCICSAWTADECACPGAVWSVAQEESSE